MRDGELLFKFANASPQFPFAIVDDQAALDRLLERLADVPTPAGPTPRQLGAPATATRLPIVDVRHPNQA